MKKIAGILLILLIIYGVTYGCLYDKRTLVARSQNGQLAYWRFTKRGQDGREHIFYRIYLPAYCIHKKWIGIGELHILDPDEYSGPSPQSIICTFP